MKKKKRDHENIDNLDVSDEFKLFKPEWFQLPSHIPPKPMKKYIESKKETENLRKQLLKLIKSENTFTDSDEIPNNEEKNLIKYYYYIHQGVDIVNIAPLDTTWIENILSLIPPALKVKRSLIDDKLTEVQEDFLFSIKKSVIDFTLQDFNNTATSKKEEKSDLVEIQRKTDLFEMTRKKIKKNLFKIHPTVVKVSQLWFLQYRDVRIINVNQLRSSDALDLNQFSDWLSSQIELCKNIILERWIPSVFKMVSHVVEKKSFAEIKEKKLKKFYECLSTLMTLQLQTLCYKSIKEYTSFVCDVKKSPGFQVHVLYKNNKIIFNPSFKEFSNTFLKVFSSLTAAVAKIPRIETKLNFENLDNMYLKPLILAEVTETCRNEVEETLQNEWICPELKIQDFDEYVCLINGQSRIEVNKFLSEDRPFCMFKEKVSYYRELGTEISLLCSRVETIGTFELHREHFISILINKSQATKDRFLLKITDTYQDACKRLNEEFQIIKDTLLKPPANTAELVQLKEYCLKLGTVVFFEMEDRLRETMNYILFCSDYVPLTSSQIKQNSVTFLCYRRINGILEENRNIIKEKTKVFQDLLLSRIEAFKRNLEKYRVEVEEFQNYRDASELSKYLKKAQNLHKKFNMAQERIREFNEEEIAFGWMTTSYPKRDELVEKLSPYKKLYENCADYKSKYQIWTEAKVGTFEPDDIEKDVENFHGNIIELSKEFSSNPAPYALTNSIRQDVEQFQKHMPIVKTLGNPCLKDRHWEKISEIVGFPLRADDDLTLAKILDYGLEEYVSKFQTISDSASKESNLEMKLNQMVSEWKDIKFEIAPYRDSGTFILITIEEIQILLDDHIVKTQTMKNSPYIKPFENTIHSWEEKLILLQDIIDCWLSVQKTWLYLEPIFTFSDIQHQIPEESKRFSAVDKTWKDIMKATSSNTSVLVVINIEKMLERLGKCKTLLNMIQNGLGGYLETKRLFFPRFFFLSNKEILSFISNTRDPAGVEPYLKKCFAGIQKLRFNADADITGVISDLEEELPLSEVIDTGSHRGQMEKWLADLERVMRNSVKQEIKNALADYETRSHDEWISSWTQQVVCLVSGIVATGELTRRLSDAGLLREYLKKLNAKIEKMVACLPTSLQMKKRYILVSLVFRLTHTRDILLKLIEKPDIDRAADYLMQLRYYTENDDVVVSMVNSSIEYGYEYVGNFIPMVVTPETDSCYKSFFIAFKYNYGVYLEGPAGVGKTEVIRDFARTMARHCVVFSCLKTLDYLVIEKFFKGVVSSGIWVCFDNLNVVQPEGLKMIEHYVMCIQQAIQFSDCNVKLNESSFKRQPNHLVFATVSAGHHEARFELPSLLQKFCRCVSLGQVSYRKVLELKLLTAGFKKYQLLAEKLEAVFKIGADLFESRNYFHNDVRILNTILKIAECTKRQRRDGDEESIVAHAVESVCRPLFHAEDWLLFKKMVTMTLKSLASAPLNEFLTNKVREACVLNNVVFDGNIFEKVEQLSSVMNQHTAGIILVGDSFGGKSTILKVLASTLKLSAKPPDSKTDIETVVINPKSVTLKQLFGHHDQSTSKWVDGILTANYRQFFESKNVARKWLIFDGPMDVTWMENLNTVLDDSRKLCLENGETIPRSNDTTLIFETSNLDYVSPLTISRCSIIVMNPDLMKWEYLITSWLNELPSLLTEQQKQHINALAIRFCRPLFHFIDSVSELTYPITKNHMIKSLCNIFDCFVDDYQSDVFMQSTPEIDIRSQLEGVFFFSCIWSLGAVLDKTDKQNFDILFRALQCKVFPADVRSRFGLPEELCRPPGKQYVYTIPDLGTVFDYQYIKEGKGKWKLWSDSATSTSAIPRELQFRQIIVPTKTTIRNHHLISLLTYHQKIIMFVGETASGKTVDVTHFLNTRLDTNLYKPVFLNFTAGTTGNSIQHLINCRLDKRKKGVYGPPLGIRYILFIDDINAAVPDQHDINSAVELLRHWVEFKQWYNLDKASVVQLIDLQLLCAFTTKPDGRRSLLSSRFTKFLNIINNDSFDDETLKSIFSKIMLWHLDTRGFSKEFDPCIDQIVDATLAIHRLVQKYLLPVPEKSHYVFNLRDLSKIIQGVVLSVPEAIEDLSAMKRLWIHEVTRIYHDRIIDQHDSNWFVDNLRSVTSEKLKEDLDILMQHLTSGNESQINQTHLRKLIFCDFINPKADVRNYAEVQDMDGLQSIVEGYLTEYNNVNKKPMNLLLFSYAIEHISRICRILKQPQGHTLLLGEYGSGKQSLARLAIHMCEYEFFEIELSSSYDEQDWREDMKSLLFSVYTDQHSAFLFTNVQKMAGSMLEDMSNLLQYAEIPEIYTADEKKEIYEKMEMIDNQRDKAMQTDGSHEALFNLFLQRIKKQIHVVVVVNSSISDFRKYIYKYSAFVNCCTIDWFEPWPKETQNIVARKLLLSNQCEYHNLDLIIELCDRLHCYAKRFSVDLATKHSGVNVFFTQKSFIRLITTFRDLFVKKNKELSSLKKLYTRAIQRVSHVKEQIPVLDYDFKTLQPTIQDKRMQMEQLESTIEAEREIETEAEIAANGAKTVVNNCEKKLNARKREYENKIKEIQDIRENVTEHLQTLTTNDIAVLKTMKNPPKPVKLVAEALVYIKEIRPEKAQESGKIVEDFWKPAVKLVNDSKFIESLVNFEISDVSPRVVRLLEDKILPNEDFDVDRIKSYSAAAEAIYRWVLVVYEFNKLTKMDSDVKMALTEAEEEHAAAKCNATIKEKHLEEIQTKRQNLLRLLEEGKNELSTLELKETTCFKKRTRATELVDILENKMEYWLQKSRSLDERNKTLTGNTLLCAATLSYLTSLSQELRDRKIEEWHAEIHSSGLECSSRFSLAESLLDELEIEKEKLLNLLDDRFFYDNLAIIRNSTRYSLAIDPQGIMNAWIRNAESENSLMVIRPDSADFLRNLENAISSCSPVLLENVSEVLDSMLYSIFDKQSYKTSGGVYLKLGKNSIAYNSNFRLYLSTKLHNPRFDVEIYEKLTVVNCTMPPSGIQNFLLKALIQKDRPDLETARNQFTAELINLKRIIAESEMRILRTLAQEKDILEDETEVNCITTDAVLIEDNTKKIFDVQSQLDLINVTFTEYLTNAKYFANLFQIAGKLPKLNRVYQFSMKWFENLIACTIGQLEKEKSDKRQQVLSDLFLSNFYSTVSHFLVGVDQLVFGYLLSLDSVQDCHRELAFLNDSIHKYSEDEFCQSGELLDRADCLSDVPEYENLRGHIESAREKWEKSLLEGTDLPDPWECKLSNFQKMVLRSYLRPDGIMTNIRAFVNDNLEEQLETVRYDLNLIYRKSSCCVPIAVVLFDSSDPVKQLLDVAISTGITSEKCHLITLTESDDSLKSTLFDSAKVVGSWIVIRNLQFAGRWFGEVEKMLEALTPSTVHPDFRLWFILRADVHCPEFIWQNSFTVAYQPGRLDVKLLESELQARLGLKDDYTKRTSVSQKFLFSNLSAFHVVLAESTRSLSLNEDRPFDDVDFQIAFNEICSFIRTSQEIHREGIISVLGDCYGSKLGDVWDSRYLKALLRSFWIERDTEINGSSAKLDWSSSISSPTYPLSDAMTKLKLKMETRDFVRQLLTVQGSQECAESGLIDLIEKIERICDAMPESFAAHDRDKLSTDSRVFANRAVANEIEYFNAVVVGTRIELMRLKKSLQGYFQLTEDVEAVQRNLETGRMLIRHQPRQLSVPQFSMNVECFETSMKAKRSFFLQNCFGNSLQTCDLSMLEFPRQCLILSLLQRCLDLGIPMNEVDFDTYTVSSSRMTDCELSEIRVSGLQLRNALWNADQGLVECRGLGRPSDMPTLCIAPQDRKWATADCVYVCPVYKTRTSGRNERKDFVVAVAVPTTMQPDTWILRSVELITERPE